MSTKIYASQDYVNEAILGKISAPQTAAVGQTIVVKSVDENGKPTEWELVNFPTDDYINSLIDAKLAAIPVAEEVSF